MAVQFSTTLRNNRSDQIETTIGVSPTLCIFSGSAPANCGASNTGTVLSTMTLPSDFMKAANNGSKELSGTWQDASADATGTAGHFRIFTGANCHIQGTISASGGGGDMVVSTTSFTTGVIVTVNSFTLTEGNA